MRIHYFDDKTWQLRIAFEELWKKSTKEDISYGWQMFAEHLKIRKSFLAGFDTKVLNI
jgi:hypothetical protein